MLECGELAEPITIDASELIRLDEQRASGIVVASVLLNHRVGEARRAGQPPVPSRDGGRLEDEGLGLLEVPFEEDQALGPPGRARSPALRGSATRLTCSASMMSSCAAAIEASSQRRNDSIWNPSVDAFVSPRSRARSASSPTRLAATVRSGVRAEY